MTAEHVEYVVTHTPRDTPGPPFTRTTVRAPSADAATATAVPKGHVHVTTDVAPTDPAHPAHRRVPTEETDRIEALAADLDAILAAHGATADDPDALAYDLARAALAHTDTRGRPATVHACPPEGAAVAPCCYRTPFDLPRADRITLDRAAVTCTGLTAAHAAPGAH